MSTIRHKDHISNLPNEILSRILARLPIKDAVRTCVLSPYWKLKWISIHDVDIDSENLSSEEIAGETSEEIAGETFVSIAENVLLNVLSVRKCRLICISLVENENELDRFARLLSAILRRNVKCLEVEISNWKEFYLPHSLSNCASLTKLILYFSTPCTFRVPTNNYFRKLKELSLGGVTFSNYMSTDKLVFNFPVLKLLDLTTCRWMVKFVEIYAPSICKVSSITPDHWVDRKEFDYSIKIFGEKVDKFTTGGGYPENIRVMASTVGNASLRCTFNHALLSLEECGLHTRNMFRELPNLTCLSIFDLRAIGQTEREVPLPRFTKLNRLYLYTPFDAEGFLKLLHAAPSLKFLAIHLDGQFEYDYDSAVPLPSCIVHHLEEVRFNYAENDYLPSNYLVEKSLLKNGANLKTIFILARQKFLRATENDLSKFPKASPFINIVLLKR